MGGFGTSILGGAALGAGAWLSDQLAWPLSLLIPANATGAWLGVAFALGASARTISTGALRGLVGLLSAVAAYYALTGLFGEGFRAIGASHAATVWGAVALIAGPAFGLAGGTWRHGRGRPRALSVALLAAALIAEGVVFGAGRWTHPDQLVSDPGAFVMAGEVIVGAALPWVLLRPGERRAGYLATAVMGVIAVLAIGPFTSVLRTLADTF